jgi:hypothetical protein
VRSVILIVATSVILVCGFAVYWLMQPSPIATSTAPRGEAPVVRPLERGERSGIIGAGEGAWAYQYDDRGRLASRFRAARYEPREAGTFGVSRPVAELFLNGGQVLRIAGETGEVTFPEADIRPDTLAPAGTTAAPSRGELREVLISLFDSEEQADASAPSLTIAVANAAFDNITFQIHTESHVNEEGQLIARDQVPVSVRSTDVDFDGRGLIIRWNELDQRLEYVEITHGERLELRNVAAVSLPGVRPEAPVPDAAAPIAASTEAAPPGDARGDERPPAASEMAEGVYRVTFHHDVRVTQAGEEVATGDAMSIDFRLGEEGSTPRGPAVEDAAVPGQPGRPEPAESAQAEEVAPDGGSEPVLVYWSGKLTLTPAEEGMDVPPGEAVVGLVGAPLLLHQGEGQISAASLLYSTADSALRIAGSDEHPLLMHDGRGTQITTTGMTWLPANRTATLHGRSRAMIPLEDGEHLAAEWEQVCTLGFAEERGLAITQAVLEKDVQIRHPSLDLDAQHLSLHFDEAGGDSESSRLQLRRLVAAGDALCVLRDGEAEPRRVEAERLLLETALTDAGQLYPRLVQAEGAVRMRDETQSLSAREAELVLGAPEAGPAEPRTGSPYAAARVERMRAAGDVQYQTMDGAAAEGDELTIEVRDGQPHVRLAGQPARITDGQNTVAGPEIDVDPQEQTARVRGAGWLRMHDAPAADAPPRVADVNWTQEAVIAGRANMAELIGAVVVRTDDPDGTINEGRAGRVRIHLADAVDETPDIGDGPGEAATAGPGELHHSALPPAGQEGGGLAIVDREMELNFLQGKAARTIEFLDEPRFESTLLAEDGAVLKRSALLAERVLEYDVPQRRMVVRGPGRLLYEDRRAEEADPQRAEDERQQRMSQRGATAFQWSRGLIYDETERTAVMDGNVLVVHEGQGDQAVQFTVEAPTLTAEMEEEGTQLRRLLADQGLRFQSGGLLFDAAVVELEDSRTIVARGSGQYPARLYEEQGLSSSTFEELRYNLETGALQITSGAGRVRPR